MGKRAGSASPFTRFLPCCSFHLTPKQVAFSWIAAKKPHLLLLDEPTNHLDLETIDSLARAINEFDGGCVLVSHDFRLIQQVLLML